MTKFNFEDYLEEEENYPRKSLPKKKKNLRVKPRKNNKIRKFKD